MEAITEKKTWTDEELMALPRDGYKYELIDGDIEMSPTGLTHGNIASYIVSELTLIVRKKKIGFVVDSSTGFRMKQGDVLSPDVSFISIKRLSGHKRLPEGFYEGAPDIAVEILSPNDRIHALHKKLAKYFDNGTKLCWVVNPTEETVYVYHSPTRDVILTKADTLDGEDVVPGFKLSVSELFEGIEI